MEHNTTTYAAMQKLVDSLRDKIYRDTLTAAEFADRTGNSELGNALRSSIFGGNCERCLTPWERVKIEGRKDEYYVPGCRCFPVCRNCGRNQWEQAMLGRDVSTCVECKHDVKSGRLYRKGRLPDEAERETAKE